MKRRLTSLLAAVLLLSACAEDRALPRSVSEFVEDPILLEAALVRCSRDRVESRYDPECINAREAVNLVEAQEDEIRRAELEARSEAKRRALRRRQEVQTEARRLAEDERRRREQAEYLAQFEGGFRVFSYLTLRGILAAGTALAISLLVGPR